MHRDGRKKKWTALVGFCGRTINAGSYVDELGAAIARDKKARKLGFSEEAMNFPKQTSDTKTSLPLALTTK